MVAAEATAPPIRCILAGFVASQTALMKATGVY
jgi:hypothetical protein